MGFLFNSRSVYQPIGVAAQGRIELPTRCNSRTATLPLSYRAV